MSFRLVVLAMLLAVSCGVVRAEQPDPTIQTTTTEATGDTGRGCLVFDKDPESSAQASDFLTLEPAARPGIQVTGTQICLSGLAYGTRYTVTVKPGLGFAGGVVKRTAEKAQLNIPDRDPLVAVAGRGWILPRQGATGLTIQTVNVPVVRIRVLRISERTLVANIPVQYALRPDPSKQSFQLGDIYTLTDGLATEIWSGTMQTAAGRNSTVETAFPLAGIIDPAKPGAYIVLAENAAQPPSKLTHGDNEPFDEDEYQRQIAGHWVLSSDLGVSTLQGQDGLHVTVRSLGSAAPLPNIKLQLLSRAQDVLGEATTDADGDAVFAPGLMRGKRGAAATVLLASNQAGDIAAQDLTAPAFDLSDRGAEGRAVPGPIEAYVYTDRGIYRPGETVQVMALLRTHGLSAVDGTGLTLVLRRPDGVEAQPRDAAGSAGRRFPSSHGPGGQRRPGQLDDRGPCRPLLAAGRPSADRGAGFRAAAVEGRR